MSILMGHSYVSTAFYRCSDNLFRKVGYWM